MTTMEIPNWTKTVFDARFAELAFAAEASRSIFNTDVAHEVVVDRIPNNHGYPYQARCSCSWVSLAHTTRFAAEAVAAEHAAGRLTR